MAEPAVTTVDEYIATFPAEVQSALRELRAAIIAAAPPQTVESISYQMPSYSLEGSTLTFFAGWKAHLALYAVPRFEGRLEKDVAPYRAAKDTLKFPAGRDLPLDLIARIVAELSRRIVAHER